MKFSILLFLILIIQLVASNDYNDIQCTNFNDPNYYAFHNPLYNKVPICYIQPKNAIQAQKALMYAQSYNKSISVRSGGHSACAFSILNNTVNIDFSAYNDVYVDVFEKTALVQTGATLMKMFNATTKYGLATSGGSCPSVGMGIALGGGSNNLASSYGYLSDNIMEMTVLLANGQIIKANPKNRYRDLYYAMAGSGHGGFGIALDFKIKLYSIPNFFYKNSIKILDFNEMPRIVKLLDDYVMTSTQDTQDRIYINIFSMLFPGSTKPTGSVSFFYNGPLDKGEAEFRKLLSGFICPPRSIKTCDNCTTIGSVSVIDAESIKKSYWDIVMSVALDNFPRRDITKGRFIKKLSDPRVANAYNAIFSSAIANIISSPSLASPDPNLFISGAIYYHGGNQNRARRGTKDEPFNSFIHRGEEAMWSYVVVSQYDNPANDPLFENYKEYINSRLPDFGTEIYNNYPDDQIENWQKHTYGEHNYKVLQQIKQKYDPNNYFNYPQSIELPGTSKNKLL